MGIKAVCSACFAEYDLKSELAGKKARCRECGEVFRIPGTKAKQRAKSAPARDEDDEDELESDLFGGSGNSYSQPVDEDDDNDDRPRFSRSSRTKTKAKKRAKWQSPLGSLEDRLSAILTHPLPGVIGAALLAGMAQYYASQDLAMATAVGLISIYSMGLLVLIVWIWLLAVAFRESPLSFLLIMLFGMASGGGVKLFLPALRETPGGRLACALVGLSYPLYFIVTNWDACCRVCFALVFVVVSGLTCAGIAAHHHTEFRKQRNEMARNAAAPIVNPAANANPFGDEAPAAAPDAPPARFDLSSVPIPEFPEMKNEISIPGTKVTTHHVALYQVKKEHGPGKSMIMSVYFPEGEHAPHSRGCVLVPPAGTNLLRGGMPDIRYHAESLPYAEAGYFVVRFSLDGPLTDFSPDAEQNAKIAFRQFAAAQAGLVNARNALEFVLARIPEVDPNRIFIAGHSSAGVLSLLFAEHEPRLKGCIAYAAAADVEAYLKDVVDDPASQQALPGLTEFVRRSSPKNHLQHLNCPVFLFHARDDSNEPFATSANLAGELQNLGKRVTFRQAQTGNHYESMIREGIPQAIAWLGTLPGEAPIGVSPSPTTNSLETPRPPGTLLENRPAAPPPEPPRQSEPPQPLQPLRPPVRMPRRPLPGRAKSPSF